MTDREIKNKKLLKVLIEIHKWEQDQLCLFKNKVAREIYFNIAEDLLRNNQGARSIKQQILPRTHSERAARTNVRKLEQGGILRSEKNSRDARLKRIIPTEAYLKKLNDHLRTLQSICSKYYLMIEID